MKTSLQAIGEEVDNAKSSVRTEMAEGWTRTIDEALLLDNLIRLQQDGKLKPKLEELFYDAVTKQGKTEYIVREYIIDRLFLTTVAIIMTSQSILNDNQNQAYEEALSHTKSLGQGDYKYGTNKEK